MNCFSYKVWEKKSLMVQTSVWRKRLKNKQIAISMHHFVIRLPLEPGYLPKRSNLMQNNPFTWKYNLHENFCNGIHQQIRILRSLILRFLHSDDNLFRNRFSIRRRKRWDGIVFTLANFRFEICAPQISLYTKSVHELHKFLQFLSWPFRKNFAVTYN